MRPFALSARTQLHTYTLTLGSPVVGFNRKIFFFSKETQTTKKNFSLFCALFFLSLSFPMSFSRLFRSRHTTSRSSGPTTTEEVTAVVGFSQ